MDFETLVNKYDFRKIKNNHTYNGAKLQITEIKRKDGDPMTRKAMIKLCDSFLAELREKYPDVDGSSVFQSNTPRWYSGDVSSFNQQSIISPQVIRFRL
jgi:hypothetical protein